MPPFEPVDPRVRFPDLEEQILASWRATDVFHRSLEQRRGGPLWVFYEGPPTANGMPGTHHVEARVFKDVFPRYRTMKGYHVPRMAGWDCHGLPVELAVEKELGFSGKAVIHPTHVEPTNRILSPSPEEVAEAKELLAAYEAARAEGRAAVQVKGALMDEAMLPMMRNIIERGRAAGIA